MIEPRLLARLELKKAALDGLRPLPAAAEAIERQLMIEWIYNSSALEGNTLSLRQVRTILETGRTVGGKLLSEHLEVLNLQQAMGYVTALAASQKPIIPLDARRLHQLALVHLDDDNAGRYRIVSVSPLEVAYQPPAAPEVPRLMREWGNWLNGPARQLHPVEQAALAHQRLIAIHPFLRGNGNVARLIMNALLMRAGYPLAVILRVNQRHYRRVLELAAGGKVAGLVNLVASAVERSLTFYLEACRSAELSRPHEDIWLPLHEAARDTPYRPAQLCRLARSGRLEAWQRGRTWLTTRRAVADYLEYARRG